ncbi:MAG: hypothetical protein ACOYZ7_04420 [Chloroflexota bacterium]
MNHRLSRHWLLVSSLLILMLIGVTLSMPSRAVAQESSTPTHPPAPPTRTLPPGPRVTPTATPVPPTSAPAPPAAPEEQPTPTPEPPEVMPVTGAPVAHGVWAGLPVALILTGLAALFWASRISRRSNHIG